MSLKKELQDLDSEALVRSAKSVVGRTTDQTEAEMTLWRTEDYPALTRLAEFWNEEFSKIPEGQQTQFFLTTVTSLIASLTDYAENQELGNQFRDEK